MSALRPMQGYPPRFFGEDSLAESTYSNTPSQRCGRTQAIHPMTLVRDEKSLSGTVSYKYMMLILRTYNGSSRRFNLPIKQ